VSKAGSSPDALVCALVLVALFVWVVIKLDTRLDRIEAWIEAEAATVEQSAPNADPLPEGER